MAGRLIYLMGPSGAGKDSLLLAARESLQARGCRVARRVITRSAEAVGEDALAVTEAEFTQLRRNGAFALDWQANGLHYGISRQIDEWLEAGEDVLVNGSRGYLGEARDRYPQLQAVLLSVTLPVLRERLLARGRESLEEIEARLARNQNFQSTAEQDETLLLDNSGPLEETVQRLLELIDRARACA
ncbi:phosphonate metabolism protein PhnN [Pseudomonas sp. MT-1]|uniref:phosphonate metabolism protein/1,5-bisphosphokinase (PRPP-forming) PhnN n=1 Tax=Stutzerimonas stutzeri TaxID=316 RepID=UPI000536141B|nr:phosphonate metabolism protein/1,5-bisphosphokinase (PRPP-forming) PhnN [Stutzerimonas stutzeri]MCQ4283406.1 phosphonate metabolism protein/1,5-bisphosphokinase (PRPP-forming) PhnN [Stutzerimonas stutzeri]BAP81124.1 phosphonate metabolism protein PhnN [Pseudomonas sp. MT-1]